MKNRFQVDKFPNITRSTERQYTHAVVVIPEGGEPYSGGFCGSLELAVKKMGGLQARHARQMELFRTHPQMFPFGYKAKRFEVLPVSLIN